MNKNLELRSFNPELRAASESEPTKLVGYAAVFNSPTDICGLFTETDCSWRVHRDDQG